MDSNRLEPIVIGADGFVMLALSTVLMLLSAGTTLLFSFGYVFWIAWRTPNEGPPQQRILVLGMRLDEAGQPTTAYRGRLARARALWSLAPSGQIAVLGGRTTLNAPSEAAAGAAVLRAGGVPEDHILIEDRSRHTLENLVLYRARLADRALGRALLVTSRFHLARSSLLANGLGIPHLPCAAEDGRLPSFRDLRLMMFEAVLIHWYVTGRTFSRLTRNKHMAGRIT